MKGRQPLLRIAEEKAYEFTSFKLRWTENGHELAVCRSRLIGYLLTVNH